MNRKRLFWQIYPSYLLISLASIIILLLISRFTFKSFYYQEKARNLLEKVYLVEGNITDLIINNEYDLIQKKIMEMDSRSHTRLTVVLPDGKVLADSQKDIALMNNHSDRPEIISAFQGLVGMSKRYSHTMKEDHLYQAIPLTGPDDKLIGVLRSSTSVENLKPALFNITKQVFWQSLVVVIVLSLVIGWYSKSLTSPIEKIKSYTEKISEGDFGQNIDLGEGASQELDSLAKALNQMKLQISSNIEKIIKQKNEKEAIFSSMVEGILSVDTNKNMLQINDAAKTFYELDSNKIFKGIPLLDVIRNNHLNDFIDEIFSCNCIVEKEIELNNEQVLQVHGNILKNQQNETIGAILVFNDVTKLRRLELHRKEFVSNVSHELRTPLTSIQGYIEVLLENNLTQEERDKFLGICKKNASRLQNIIEDLLALSQIEKEEDNNEIRKEIRPIEMVVNSALQLCQNKAQKKGITLKTEITPELEGNINVHLLEQALINLIDNAIKYGHSDSQITISATVVVDHIEISVKDEGPGIAKNHQERLFERFYCIDKARSRELGGSGLGLSIVKHIAIVHGGFVTLDSILGKGSTFKINIPST